MAIETPQTRYDKKWRVPIAFRFNKRTDADVLEWLEKQPTKQGAIKKLIREEIEREKALQNEKAKEEEQ